MTVYAPLREREAIGNPIRVGMGGAGAAGGVSARQLGTPAPWRRLAAIAHRAPTRVDWQVMGCGDKVK